MSSKSLIVLLATVVAVAGLLLLTRTVVQLGAPTVRQPSVFQSADELSLAEARQQCPIPLPATASHVQFAVWSCGDATQTWVRFDAPVADCLAHAALVLEEFRQPEDLHLVERSVVGDPPPVCVLDPSEVDLAWFDLSEFSNGMVFEAERGRAPVVWVDTDRGRFYYEAKNARRAPQFP